MLNIVVPMAGRGSRFGKASYAVPKPLIPVGGRPMVEWVVRNVRPEREHRFVFICLKEHLERYSEVPEMLQEMCAGCEIVEVDEVTEGAACTVLLARELINNNEALMIANSDQFVDIDINDYLEVGDEAGVEGLIMTFYSDHPKWSYCRMRDDDSVMEVVEKEVVSREATVGIYNFKKGKDFVWAAEEMMKKELRVNGEFYVGPVYNQLIEKDLRVVTKNIGYERAGMYGLGVPEDLNYFKNTQVFKNFLDVISSSV